MSYVSTSFLACQAMTCTDSPQLTVPRHACLALPRRARPCKTVPRHACLALTSLTAPFQNAPEPAQPAKPFHALPRHAGHSTARTRLPILASPDLAKPCSTAPCLPHRAKPRLLPCGSPFSTFYRFLGNRCNRNLFDPFKSLQHFAKFFKRQKLLFQR